MLFGSYYYLCVVLNAKSMGLFMPARSLPDLVLKSRVGNKDSINISEELKCMWLLVKLVEEHI